MFAFNTSAFSNTLGASDRAAQRKALVAPFKEEFDGQPQDVLQHIAIFTQRCQETGIVEDFNFIVCENSPPSDIDMSDTIERTKWQTDPRRLTIDNILIDSSRATVEKLQETRDTIHDNLKTLTTAPDPKKQPQASKYLVSFQNRQWLFVLLQNVWTVNTKAIMQRYEELHGNDGVILWFCFLKQFAGTTTENLIEAYSQLSESKLQLFNFNNDVLLFTNAVRAPIRRLFMAKQEPNFQHFLYFFMAVLMPQMKNLERLLSICTLITEPVDLPSISLC
jgi:hypothetical protein